jgi:hypothetical protein
MNLDAPTCLRFLEHEAMECRDRDAGEMVCLLIPSLRQVAGLEPMEDLEAKAFRHALHEALAARLKMEAA